MKRHCVSTPGKGYWSTVILVGVDVAKAARKVALAPLRELLVRARTAQGLATTKITFVCILLSTHNLRPRHRDAWASVGRASPHSQHPALHSDSVHWLAFGMRELTAGASVFTPSMIAFATAHQLLRFTPTGLPPPTDDDDDGDEEGAEPASKIARTEQSPP